MKTKKKTFFQINQRQPKIFILAAAIVQIDTQKEGTTQEPMMYRIK